MKYKTPRLKTKRLYLKRGKLKDYERVYEYDFTKLMDIDGEFEFALQDPFNIIGYDLYGLENEDVIDWIIYLRRTKRPIGHITADRISESNNSIELSYNLHPDFWGKEYMREAVISVMDYLYKLGFDNIICRYSEGNKKSKRFLEKLK